LISLKNRAALSLHYNRHLLEGLRVEFIDENGGGAG
jgi:hypothetical protein